MPGDMALGAGGSAGVLTRDGAGAGGSAGTLTRDGAGAGGSDGVFTKDGRVRLVLCCRSPLAHEEGCGDSEDCPGLGA